MNTPISRNLRMVRSRRWLTVAWVVTFSAASPAWANEPLFALPTLMSLPFMAALWSTGWSLLWVTLLESAVLMWGQRLRPGRALLLAAGANLYSTLFGFGLVVTAVAPVIMLPAFGVGAVFLARRMAVLGRRPASRPGMFLYAAAGFGLCVLSAGAALSFRSAPSAAMVLLFVTGFALTFIIEGALLVDDLQKERPRLPVMATAFWMNAASYAVLLATSGPALYQHALNGAGLSRLQRSQARSCLGNLKAIQSAKDQWALDHRQELARRLGLRLSDGAPKVATLHALGGAQPAWSDLVPGYLKVAPACPAHGTYTLGAIDHAPTCSAYDRRTHPVNLR
jgi:hypothetical protein